jgi:hypothetical protein
MPATRGSAKRKRGSDSSSDSSPAASSSQRGGASADRPSLVDCEGHWATNLRKARDDGHFLDCVLVASGGAEIRAHKAVLISHSPFLHGLFTSGLAESQQDRVELSTIDGRAAGAVVDCFYSGKVELTAASVCAVIRTAHELQVDAVERAAAQYFVDRLDPATAVSALAGFASEFVASANGRALQRKCLEYAQAHFGECVAEPAFLEQLRRLPWPSSWRAMRSACRRQKCWPRCARGCSTTRPRAARRCGCCCRACAFRRCRTRRRWISSQIRSSCR